MLGLLYGMQRDGAQHLMRQQVARECVVAARVVMKYVLHLVGPGARDVGELFHAPSYLDVLVRRVQVFQAVADVRHNETQRFPAHHDARSAHAKVLVVVERQQAELVLVAQAGLSNELGHRRVERAQKGLDAFGLYVDVVVDAHEPLESIQIVVVHELEHHERLLLGRIGVVDAGQADQRQLIEARRAGAREKGELAGHLSTPGLVYGIGARVQVLLSGHDADEHEAFGRLNGVVDEYGLLLLHRFIAIFILTSRLIRATVAMTVEQAQLDGERERETDEEAHDYEYGIVPVE